MVDGKREGYWKEYSFYDSTLGSKKLYKAGELNGESEFYKNGKLKSKYNYKENEKHGAFVEFDSLGIIINEGLYKKGELISSKIKEESPNILIADESPRYPGCEDISDLKEKNTCSQKKLLEYVYGNLRYPADARERDVQGQALAQFVVDKKGNVIDLVILSGVCESIEREVINVIKGMDTWIPGKQNGEVVQVKYTLPVKFKLHG